MVFKDNSTRGSNWFVYEKFKSLIEKFICLTQSLSKPKIINDINELNYESSKFKSIKL